MPKQVLGRDLRALLGRNPKEGAPPVDAPVSAGVRSLMRGNNPPTPAPAPVTAPATKPATAPKPLIPRWYLLAGDVLLVALALITVCVSPHPLSWPRTTFCVALVSLAAALAVLALCTRDAGTAVRPE